MLRITKLPVPPEEYCTEILDDLEPCVDEHPMMGFDECCFTNGLLSYYKPKNVLEIGVNFGEGSAQILHAIRSTPNAKLTSIDLMEYGRYTAATNERTGEKCVHTSDKPIGNFALTHPDLPLDCWTLITGKDPSEVISELGDKMGKFDFLVLDTAHFHPIESLNFLCVLPYLIDGAIVVLHDILLWTHFNPPKAYACRHLFSSVAAERIQLKKSLYQNIGAFQITPDTRKYIQNVFESLLLPWEIDPRSIRMDSILSVLSEHYADKELIALKKALQLNTNYYATGKADWSCWHSEVIEFLILHLSAETIFYGAGRGMTGFLKYCKSKGITFVSPIWDIAADNIKEICGHKVDTPDISSPGDGKTLVITIEDEAIRKEVRRQFSALGYTVKDAHARESCV
ncbi:MAG: class I SAM-dependent methyltransferase [Oscillospiraceae bacterium]|nr:class I SAM-dependent methyltransferase [Oscillospiraceae bacterium]